MTRRSRLAIRPRLESLEERLVLSALSAAQIDSAYGLSAIRFANGAIKGSGAGQTIAIIDPYNDPSIYTDLVAFDARNGLINPYLTPVLPLNSPLGNSLPAFSMVNFAGASTNSSWAMEEALDVEMAHAAAPMANIVLVEARTPGVYDFLTAINAVKSLPSVSVISVSWGGPEFQGQQAFDSTFTTPVGHRGITFLASSGDSGAGAQWPASSPNVLGVGGTTLSVNSTGARASESAWSGSGGAASQVVPKPIYQFMLVPGAARSTPDVSFDADPGTGLVIISQGAPMQVGGTSLAAPGWAGLIAIADQGLALAGQSSMDGATQTLPGLYRASAGSFFDVKTGPRATFGYDTATGLGSPNAAFLVGSLDGNSTGTGTGTPSLRPGGGTTTSGSGGAVSPSITLPDPTSTLPSIGQLAESGTPGTASPELVANLVAVGSPTILLDPKAIDAILEGWGTSGVPAARRVFATKPRG